MHRAVSRTQLRDKFGIGRSLEPMVPGDSEDPCQRGILRKSSCHTYRQRLQSNQQANLFQAMIMLMGMTFLIAVLWLQTVRPSPSPASDHNPATEQVEQASMADTLKALWLGVSDILGLDIASTFSGRSYHCNQELDTKRIFRHISKQVLNQERALAQLERVVKNDQPVRSVALVGPPGVGKTLTASLLSQQFPWPENVHSYSWNHYDSDSAHMMRSVTEQISSCGQNLVIVDNIAPCDYKFVSVYNKLLMERDDEAVLPAEWNVLVIYIFTMESQYYWQQFELLQQLPMVTTIINYRPFGRAELMSCLENELRQKQHTLDMRTLSVILEKAMLDVEEVGCMRIRQLLIQHGLPETK